MIKLALDILGDKETREKIGIVILSIVVGVVLLMFASVAVLMTMQQSAMSFWKTPCGRKRGVQLNCKKRTPDQLRAGVQKSLTFRKNKLSKQWNA